MPMPYELFLALRYLRPRRGARMGSVHVTALAAIVGITCGVAALVVATALANGFRDEMRDKILRGTAHVTVARADGASVKDWRMLVARLRRVEGVTDAAPTSYTGALLEGSDAADYAVLRAVDASSQRDLAEIRRTLISGAVETLFDNPHDETARAARDQSRNTRDISRRSATEESSRDADEGEPSVPVVVGAELAARTGLRAVGDTGWLVLGEKIAAPPGFATRSRRVRVVGIIRTGLFEYDSTWVYLSLANETEIAGATTNSTSNATATTSATNVTTNETNSASVVADSASVISVETADIYRTPETAARIRKELGAEFSVVDWQEANRPLFAALALERKTVSLIIALVVAVAALNITTTLVLVVVERRADIAILGALGARASSVMAIFICEGAALGALGAGLGAMLGLAACFVADRFKLVRLPADVYSLSFVPLHPRVRDAAIAAVVAFLICLVATVYPAQRAARLRVAEALRHE